MSLSLGKDHMFVRLARSYERFFGSLGDAHLCVTEAMKKFLTEDWKFRYCLLFATTKYGRESELSLMNEFPTDPLLQSYTTKHRITLENKMFMIHMR